MDMAGSSWAGTLLAQAGTNPMLQSFAYDFTVRNHVLAEFSYKYDLVYSIKNTRPVYTSKPNHGLFRPQTTTVSLAREKGTSSMIKGTPQQLVNRRGETRAALWMSTVQVFVAVDNNNLWPASL